MKIETSPKFKSIQYESSLIEKIIEVSNMIEKTNRNKASWVVYCGSDVADKIENSFNDFTNRNRIW